MGARHAQSKHHEPIRLVSVGKALVPPALFGVMPVDDVGVGASLSKRRGATVRVV